jgi:hypothetical protein
MRWLVVALCTGCYAPEPRAGAPCPTGRCPQGLVCSAATSTCERDFTAQPDAATTDARLVDASADVDAPRDAAPATATLVQQQTTYVMAGSTASVTLPSTPVNGNVLVMIGGTPSGSLDSVSGGATWTRAALSVINSNIEIWYGVANGASATVTIQRGNNAAPMWIAASEWSALANTSTLVAAVDRDGVSGSVSAGTLPVTTAPALLVFAATAYTPVTWGAPTPGTWTALAPIEGAVVSQRAWYTITASTGSFTPVTSLSGGAWDANLVALRIAP